MLIVGAGPAGLIAALQLSKNGTRCMLIERNLSTTKWPKMDITNCRSMELLKRLGVDTGLRNIGKSLCITAKKAVSREVEAKLSSAPGVSQNYSFDVNFSTGLSEKGQSIEKWVRREASPRPAQKI